MIYQITNEADLETSMDKKEAQEPQDLLGTHHQEGHGNGCFCTSLQPGHDQIQRILAFPRSKHSFHFIAAALIGSELLFACSCNASILGWSAQWLAG